MRINLSAPEGNAFSLIGLAARLSRITNMPTEEAKAIRDRMMAGDYKNILNELETSFPMFDFEFQNDPRTETTQP